jgi:hypothetical protein
MLDTQEPKEKKTTDLKETPAVQAYKISWFDKIPYWIKACVFKYWSYGMVYFFFVMGLGTIWAEYADAIYIQMIVLGTAMGLLNDLIFYNVLQVIETSERESRWWLLIKNKKVYSLFINIAYGLVWGLATSFLAAFLASKIDVVFPTSWFFREPLSFALVGFIIDGVVIGVKDLIMFLFEKRKKARL